MKYNAKYDRWVSKDGLVYRYDKKNDRLVLANQFYINGYLAHNKKKDNKNIHVYVHRLVWETFNGEIPQGYEIDHINAIRDDNRLENLRVVTKKENNNNPLTRKHKSEARKGKPSHTKGYSFSEFGRKFKEHFGISRSDNITLYVKEWCWFKRHNKVCRWEVEDK